MPPSFHRNRGIIRRQNWPKTKRLTMERLMLNLRALENEETLALAIRDLTPEAWDTLEADVDVEEKKVRVTLRLDESVAKFYRAMGRGYQARINRVLATFAQMRIAEVRRAEAEEEAFEAEIDREWEAEKARMKREGREGLGGPGETP